MAPVGYGMLAKIAGIIFLAVIVGSIGGVINGRLKGELALGAILSAVTLFLVVIILESWSSGKIALFGMLPLILTFVVGSVMPRFLEVRFSLRPIAASLIALGIAMGVGFVYLMLIRLGWMELASPNTLWIAGAALLCLVAVSIWNRLRSVKSQK